MGPTMPPSKKAQSPNKGLGATRGLSPFYREAEAADLSLSLSASFSKAEDEELTSLSWLHESTNLLNSFSHSGLRSVSPLQDTDGQPLPPHSPSSSSNSTDPCDSSSYDLVTGANRKPPYSFSCLIFMAIEDAPSKRLPVKDIYGWILEHFPYFASAPTGWKNSVRHNLSLNKCFKKVDKDRSQSIGLVTPSTSPQAYHSPLLWPGSPFFRKNGGVLLQVSQGVIQNGACVRSQGLFPVIQPLPLSPVGRRTTAIRSALGDYLTRGDHPSYPPSDDLQEDHNYSTAKSPSMPCSSQGPSASDEDDDIIAVEMGVHRGVKSEPKEVPLDSASVSFLSQHARRRGLPWTKNRLRALGDTLPLKKRRSVASAEKPPLESDDEEMKEAAGSLLHLAGVRACLNNITNRAKAAQKEKEQKEALRN
ncbi:hypothetical protein J4Q44_G00323310 [Coregonus suidteri]|uniref:Fork-head domain-containing protein n=1 Tax=Coregonus suidteri TaxID=861788 RepID=A0AAN8KTX8_9TELE